MAMWQQLLERFVPELEDVSTLDRLDGVGSSLPEPAPRLSVEPSRVGFGAPVVQAS